jgi:hypothetical protein
MKNSLLIALVLLVAGCDYCRNGGVYKVGVKAGAPQGSEYDVNAKASLELRRQLERWLTANGFIEARSKQAVFWYKNGSRVILYTEPEGRIKVEFGAFGNNRDVRLSERTERDLMTYLKSLSGVQTIPCGPRPLEGTGKS